MLYTIKPDVKKIQTALKEAGYERVEVHHETDHQTVLVANPGDLREDGDNKKNFAAVSAMVKLGYDNPDIHRYARDLILTFDHPQEVKPKKPKKGASPPNNPQPPTNN